MKYSLAMSGVYRLASCFPADLRQLAVRIFATHLNPNEQLIQAFFWINEKLSLNRGFKLEQYLLT